jgi:hypothetical protein
MRPVLPVLLSCVRLRLPAKVDARRDGTSVSVEDAGRPATDKAGDRLIFTGYNAEGNVKDRFSIETNAPE